ncbi:MAG: hypothetical protein Q4B63_11730 [Clostridium perfringens]|nr:hypothetical protein [Clostridium perfringens]
MKKEWVKPIVKILGMSETKYTGECQCQDGLLGINTEHDCGCHGQGCDCPCCQCEPS